MRAPHASCERDVPTKMTKSIEPFLPGPWRRGGRSGEPGRKEGLHQRDPAARLGREDGLRNVCRRRGWQQAPVRPEALALQGRQQHELAAAVCGPFGPGAILLLAAGTFSSRPTVRGYGRFCRSQLRRTDALPRMLVPGFCLKFVDPVSDSGHQISGRRDPVFACPGKLLRIGVAAAASPASLGIGASTGAIHAWIHGVVRLFLVLR